MAPLAGSASATTVLVEPVDDLHIPDTVHKEVVPGGVVNGQVGMKQLRDTIPAHCFEVSTARSLFFFARDLAMIAACFVAGISISGKLDGPYRTIFQLIVYPFVTGIPCTGLWVLAHEAGHGSFSRNKWVAHSVGFISHSFLFSPYFAWRSTHSRHHVYANHMLKDHNYVPPQRDDYSEMFRSKVSVDELTEDAPFVVLLRVILQQLIGWPWYLMTNITGGSQSTLRERGGLATNSHYDPFSTLFRPDEFWSIVASDLGILAAWYGAKLAADIWGMYNVFWAYLMPILWVNHWIVMITYLHHTHPALPKFTPEAWTFMRGALATVDRDPGFILRHIFHHIIDLHVIHHLFPRIPHYHAQEATNAIRPILGHHYHEDKGSYWGALYENFTKCQWVEPGGPKTGSDAVMHGREGDEKQDDEGVLWYRPGKMPAPVYSMRAWKTAL